MEILVVDAEFTFLKADYHIERDRKKNFQLNEEQGYKGVATPRHIPIYFIKNINNLIVQVCNIICVRG